MKRLFQRFQFTRAQRDLMACITVSQKADVRYFFANSSEITEVI